MAAASTALVLVLAAAVAAAAAAAAAAGSTGTKTTAKARANAEILWDTYGVPHIFADDLDALAYAYGYAHGRDHSAATLRLIGVGRGRAAEYWGEDWSGLDASTWSSRIPQFTEEIYPIQDPATIAQLEAFAKGFTQYLVDHPEEEADLGPLLRVLPIDGQSILGIGLRAYYLFTYASSLTFTTAFDDKWADTPDTFRERVHKDGVRYAAYIDWFPEYSAIPEEFRSAFGSNGWAITAPKAAGAPKLVMNPHLPLGGFFRFTEAHFVVANLDLDVYGTGFIGLPNLQIAFNRFLGWTHTVNTIQAYTVHELELVGEDQYYLDGALLTLSATRYPYLVRQPDGSFVEESVVVEESVHGVVVRRAAGAAIAIRMAGLDRPDPIKQWWDMARARNLVEFKAALSQLQIAMFSVIGTTRDGDIFHSFNGYVPVRSEGDWAFWRQPVPGNSSRYLWNDIHPFDELPWIENPPSGWLQNANEPPWTTTFPLFPASMDPANYPPYMAPPPIMYNRPQVSARLLTSNDNITYERFVELKHSTLKEFAFKAIDELLAAIEQYGNGDPDLARVAEIWRAWDRSCDTTSRGAVLFDYWRRVAPADVWLNPWSAADPLGTPNTLRDPQACVDAIATAVRLMRLAGVALDVEYGAVHRLPFGPRPENGLVLPGNGGDDTFRNTWYAPGDNGLGPAGGDSFVCIVEFSESGPRASSLLGYGNASPGSRAGQRHINDQMDRYSRKELKPVHLTRAEIAAHLEESVALSYP